MVVHETTSRKRTAEEADNGQEDALVVKTKRARVDLDADIIVL